ncbi:MAG: CPBP family intramembrane glutamic endopeptidase [Ferruginibacter sp.]
MSKISPFTIAGLFLAFFGPLLILIPFQIFAPGPLTNTVVIFRELLLFLMAGLLILLVIKGEKLDLNSIGLNNRHWGKSFLWSLVLLLLFFVVLIGCLGLFKLTGIKYGQGDHKYDKISLWVMTLMMLRAGIVEEVFYRGYIMERLNKISNKWPVYLLLPSIIFGLLHYKQGIGGIIIATASGILFSCFYWKKRDLKINIMAHFMADFIPNILIPVIMGNS